MPFGGTSTGLARWRLKHLGRRLKDIVCANQHVGGTEGSGEVASNHPLAPNHPLALQAAAAGALPAQTGEPGG